MSDINQIGSGYVPTKMKPPRGTNNKLGTYYLTINGVPAIVQNYIVYLMTRERQAQVKEMHKRGQNGYGWKVR